MKILYAWKQGDSIHDGQLEGLAIIDKYLDGDISIVWLYPEGEKIAVGDCGGEYSEIHGLI